MTMTFQMDHQEQELHKKYEEYLKSGEIEVVKNPSTIDDDTFIYKDFPWKVEYIDWEKVPNSSHCLVQIPYKPEESHDFTTRMIKENDLKGSVFIAGDHILEYDYRMDISLFPLLLWDFMQIPLYLYAVNAEQKWCFSFNSFRHLNFGYAPRTILE